MPIDRCSYSSCGVILTYLDVQVVCESQFSIDSGRFNICLNLFQPTSLACRMLSQISSQQNHNIVQFIFVQKQLAHLYLYLYENQLQFYQNKGMYNSSMNSVLPYRTTMQHTIELFTLRQLNNSSSEERSYH